jgi:ASC-1-like (ASCH) protein
MFEKHLSIILKRHLAVSKNYYEKFEEILNEINWNEQLDHLNDVDEICEKFYKVFPKNSERKYSDKNSKYSKK